MTTLNTPEPKFSKRTKVLTFVALLTLAIIVYAISWFGIPGPNYAEEVAKPIETALIKAGATKMCSRGDAGRGWDNREPWYSAVYEIGGNQSQTANVVKDIAYSNGYNLVDASQGINAEDRQYLGDNMSKKSPYGVLREGNIDLQSTIYNSQTYAENSSFCGVKKREDESNGKTTFDINISMPSFKR